MAVALSELALVTGASGFIATHIIHQLLTEGNVRVRGTVRSLGNEAKVKPLREIVPDATYPLELVEADLTNEESWKEAVKDCTYVYHVASPFPSSIPRDEDEIIKPAVNGTLNVLRACSSAGCVKRVVLTSSIAAIYSDSDKKTFTESDWATEENSQPYQKSKLLAERAAWEYLNQLPDGEKYELVAVNPSLVIGPVFSSVAGASTSQGIVEKLLSNGTPALANCSFSLVDVRDVAKAHIAAMKKPDASGNRYIISSCTLWMKEIADIIAAEFKPQGYSVPRWVMPKPGIWAFSLIDSSAKLIYPLLGKKIEYDNGKMQQDLNVTPQDISTTIIDTCYSLIEHGVVEKKRGYRGKQTSLEESDEKQKDSFPEVDDTGEEAVPDHEEAGTGTNENK